MIGAPKWVRPGLLYVLRLTSGIYKIGYTRNLKSRLADYRCTCPESFELVHTIPTDDPVDAEHYVHALFHHCRQPGSGELFALNESEVAWLLSTERIGIVFHH